MLPKLLKVYWCENVSITCSKLSGLSRQETVLLIGEFSIHGMNKKYYRSTL